MTVKTIKLNKYMKKRFFSILSATLATGLLSVSCSDEPKGGEGGGVPETGDGEYVYIVAYASGDDVGYLKQVSDISQGSIDGQTSSHNRQEVSGNQDYTAVNDKYLYNINYGSQGSAGISTISASWGLDAGYNIAKRNEFNLDGDVKARGVVGNYFVAATNASENDIAYERIKLIDTESQAVITNHGKINTDASNSAWRGQVAEHTTFSDIAQYGDYVLVGMTTKREPSSKTTTTELAFNTYIGVFTLDPSDSEKEFLKFNSLLVRNNADKPSGQVKGNSRSRTETGIEPTDDGSIYVFAQGNISNASDGAIPPSTVLKLKVENGKPTGFDDSYYVNLQEKSGGHRVWRSYYLGGTKFCLQMFSNAGDDVSTSAPRTQFAIYDAATTEFSWVENVPSDITDVALFYMIEKDKRSVTFGIETSSMNPALYTVSSDGVMKRGLEVNAETIKGVARIKKQ